MSDSLFFLYLLFLFLQLCEFSEDEVSCEKSFSHDSNDEDDLEEEGNVREQDGRVSGLNGTEDEDPPKEEKRKDGEKNLSPSLKGECSPVPEIQDTAHLNGHVLQDTDRISGVYLS